MATPTFVRIPVSDDDDVTYTSPTGSHWSQMRQASEATTTRDSPEPEPPRHGARWTPPSPTQHGPSDTGVSACASAGRQANGASSTRPSSSAYSSSPLHRYPEIRAVERFFVDWIMYPSCADNFCPGYLSSTPEMYHATGASPFFLWTVRALAYSNARGGRNSDGTSLDIQAQTYYGNAIHRLRDLIATVPPGDLVQDCIVTAILLLDNWELIYGRRGQIPGSHGAFLFHILSQPRPRPSRLALSACIWRVANYRLVLHLIMSNEEEKLVRLPRLYEVREDRPYTRIVSDAFKIGLFRAEIRTLLSSVERRETSPARRDRAARLADVLNRGRHLLSNALWDVPQTWTFQRVELEEIYGPGEICAILQQRLGLPDQSVLKFHSLWIACMWTSYWALLILLHNSVADAMKQSGTSALLAALVDDASTAEGEETAARQRASDVLSALPYIMGHFPPESFARSSCESGRMLARLFALFPLFVLETSPSMTPTQKLAATNIRSWLQDGHKISQP